MAAHGFLNDTVRFAAVSMKFASHFSFALPLQSSSIFLLSTVAAWAGAGGGRGASIGVLQRCTVTLGGMQRRQSPDRLR
jgi:hypothetical protein